MRKKTILGGIAALALAGAIAFNVNINSKSNNRSDLLFADVEALAGNDYWCVDIKSKPKWGFCIIFEPGDEMCFYIEDGGDCNGELIE